MIRSKEAQPGLETGDVVLLLEQVRHFSFPPLLSSSMSNTNYLDRAASCMHLEEHQMALMIALQAGSKHLERGRVITHWSP